MTVRAFLAGLIALVCVVVAACSAPGPRPGPPAAATQPPASVPSSTPAPANPTVPPTPTDSLTLPHTTVPATATTLPSAILDAWRFLPACGEATTAIDLATLPAANQPGWKQYTQPDYGLSVAVPPDWRLAVGAHALCLAPTAAPSVILTIGFRGSIESAAIDRIAIGAGELITRGSTIILGQPATRNVLVYQGQDKAILYDGFGELYTPYLALTANLDDFGPGYAAVALPLSLQATADQIVASLASASPSTTWQTYISPIFRVSLQYPSNWKLDNSGDALYSGPDGFIQITASGNLGLSAVAFCQENLHNIETMDPARADLMGFGRHPTVETLSIDQQPACLTLPSDDQTASHRTTASLDVDYPSTLRPHGLLTLWADKVHIRDLGARLKFIRMP